MNPWICDHPAPFASALGAVFFGPRDALPALRGPPDSSSREGTVEAVAESVEPLQNILCVRIGLLLAQNNTSRNCVACVAGGVSTSDTTYILKKRTYVARIGVAVPAKRAEHSDKHVGLLFLSTFSFVLYALCGSARLALCVYTVK